tara:strand:- start:329 stop:922 length:594 start_codon:yes stop_codon:yes gene_type:complete
MTDFRASIRLKTARIAAGYSSAKEFCKKFNIPTSTYSLHETGGRGIREKAANKYANYLNIAPEWLMQGIGSPFKEIEEELNLAIKDSSPLSHEEFISLLEYAGNNKIPETKKLQLLNNVNPLILGKIFISLYETTKKLDLTIDDFHLAQKASEIYQDIILSSNKIDEQLSMVNLSMAMIKRQMEDIRVQNIKKAIKK